MKSWTISVSVYLDSLLFKD